ncbi:hypothetical protein [Oceanithermus sp.]
MRKALLLSLLLLAACTGTSEPPLDLLLAVGSGDQVVFYPAGTAEAGAVGQWSLGAAVVDLLRLEGESRLWVLTPDRLLAYPLSGGSLTSPPAAVAPSVSLEIGADCSGGRLEAGSARLLLDCGGGLVWTAPLGAPALETVDTSGDATGTVYLLGPDDRLTRVAPTLTGFTLDYPGEEQDYSFTVYAGAAVNDLAARWSAGTLLVALATDVDVRLYTWSPGTDPPKSAGDPLALTSVRAIVPLSDGWLIGGDGGYVVRRSQTDDLRRTTPVDRGLVTPNLYCYLAAAGRLTVLDLLDPELAEHPRGFPADPRGLAWLPVGE